MTIIKSTCDKKDNHQENLWQKTRVFSPFHGCRKKTINRIPNKTDSLIERKRQKQRWRLWRRRNRTIKTCGWPYRWWNFSSSSGFPSSHRPFVKLSCSGFCETELQKAVIALTATTDFRPTLIYRPARNTSADVFATSHVRSCDTEQSSSSTRVCERLS